MTAPGDNPSATQRLRASDAEVIRVEHVTKAYDAMPVLKDISFAVKHGERLVIIGASGCGKSTMLKMLVGVERPNAGAISLFGRNIVGLASQSMDEIRQRFGILFQSGALFGSMTVGDNVAFPMREHSDLDANVISIMVRMKLAMVGLAGFERKMPSTLSGGQAKRVGLARAIALDPEIIFYDEPTSGLDPITAAQIDRLILDLSRRLKVTSVVVTHDMTSAFKIADHVIMLHGRHIVESGTPEEIRQSANPAVQQFIKGQEEGPLTAKEEEIPLGSDLLDASTATEEVAVPWWRPW